MLSFYEEVIALLEQGRVEFVVVGGVSAVLQGAPIITADLDICYRRTPDNIVRLAAALKPLRPRLRNMPPDLPAEFDERSLSFGTNFTLVVGENENLDLLAEMSGLGGYEQIIKQSDEMLVAGVQVHVLPLELLITTKEAANRPKDLGVLPTLRATLEYQRKQEAAPDVPPSQT